MNTPLRLHLIRHGETNWNRERRVQGQSESTLTELGYQQARALRPQLAQHAIEAVYCSSSLRTRQTAGILFDDNITINYLDNLREIYLGPWEGRLHDDIRRDDAKRFDHFWHAPHQFNLPGAETFAGIQTRAMTACENLLKAHPEGGEVAVVSHGVWIKALLCALEPRPLAQLWLPPAMKNCAHSIVQWHNGSATIVQYAAVVTPA